MDSIKALTCLESAGVITPAQLQAMKNVIGKLPHNEGALLEIIAAATIAGGPTASLLMTGTIIDTDGLIVDLPIEDGMPSQLIDIPEGATRAIISVHGNNIIFRTDGGPPLNSNGHFAAQGSNFEIGKLSQFRCVAASATSAYLFITYF